MQAVMAAWFQGRFLPFESYAQRQGDYQTVVFVTFGREGDAGEPDSTYSIAKAAAEEAGAVDGPPAAASASQQQRWRQQRMLGMVHNPAHLPSPRMRPLLASLGPRLHLAAIAPSVAAAAQAALDGTGLAVAGRVSYIAPVFPLGVKVEHLVQALGAGAAQPVDLCVQASRQ